MKIKLEVESVSVIRTKHEADRVYFNIVDLPPVMKCLNDSRRVVFHTVIEQGKAEGWLAEAFNFGPDVVKVTEIK